MNALFPSRRLAVGLALLALAGCADFKQAGAKAHTWMHDFAWGRYHATPQQTQIANERATHHYNRLSAQKKKEMRDSGKRYVAVRTLDPTPQQLAEIKKKASTPAYAGASAGGYGMRRRSAPPPPTASAAPKGPWHCVMIWDTWAKQVVGNDCYAVTELPAVGATARFDTYSAEYIGSGD